MALEEMHKGSAERELQTKWKKEGEGEPKRR